MIEKYRVTTFYTSPTAIRMFMSHGNELPQRHDLSSLELLGSVGEPINPAAWEWYYKIIGGERCPIVDTWWQTETGGIMISPSPGIQSFPLKPGSATFPLPGVDPVIVDENGQPVKRNVKGFLVLRKPWPGMLMTLYGDDERYRQVYWERFPGAYQTGDYAIQDQEGYLWLLGRADEVLKVAGHRLSTLEIENAVVAHPAIAEAAAAPRPDNIKGEAVVVFAILIDGYVSSSELESSVKNHVRQMVGAVASPDSVHFVSRLPKTRSGKIMRRVLRAVASKKQVGDVTTLEDEASVEEIQIAFEDLRRQV
jgi:acetyl-CoA synthetase